MSNRVLGFDNDQSRERPGLTTWQNRDKVKLAARRSYERRKAWLNGLKEASPCADCGTSYPARVMQYHHIDPETKDKSVSVLVRAASRERIPR